MNMLFKEKKPFKQAIFTFHITQKLENERAQYFF